MKKCIRCQEVKPYSEYHRNHTSRDGFAYKCKPCTRLRNLELDKRTYDRELYHRRYKNDEAFKHRKQYQNAKGRNRFQDATNERVYAAIKKGTLVRQPCVVCGEEKVHAHHPDYNKALEVIWLCPAHHRQLHLGHITLSSL